MSEIGPVPALPPAHEPPRRPGLRGLLRRRPERVHDPLVVVPVFDGGRGWAIVMVMAYHCWIASYSSLVGLGVVRDFVAGFFVSINMFFVISGFLLFLPMARDGRFGSVRKYAWRRFARIVPAYYACLLGIVLLFPLFSLPSTTFWRLPHIESLGIHLVFLQHTLLGPATEGLYGFGSTVGFGYVGPLWSLTVEMYFYILLPIVAAAFLRRPLLWLGIAYAVQVLWRYLSWNEVIGFVPQSLRDGEPARATEIVVTIAYQFPAFAGNLALGMAAAVLYVRIVRADRSSRLAWLHRHAGWLHLLCGAGLLATVVLGGWLDTTFRTGTTFGHYFRDQIPALCFTGAMVFAALSGKRSQAFWAWRPVRWMGEVSYGAYLWHGMVLWFALFQFDWFVTPADQDAWWPFLRLAMFVIPLGFLLGWLSFRFIERPAIGWMRKRLSRDRRPVTPPPAPHAAGQGGPA